MKLISKIKSVMYILSAGVLAIIVLLTLTASKNSAKLDEHYKSYIMAQKYRNINIYDCRGEGIYTGGFSDDTTLRLATFHVIGDKFGSVTDSLLTKHSKTTESISKFHGFTPKEKNITLTINNKLQKGAYTMLTNYGYRGCIIICDYEKGEIKTLASTPSVDVYNTDYFENGAFLNKATMIYPPGSVFKPVTVAAILEHNPSAVDFEYKCTGKTNHIKCVDGKAHGLQTLPEILCNSCNCGISTLAKTYLTSSELDNFSKKFSVLDKNIINDLNVAEGSIDSSEDLMWTANGQGKTMVTPLNIIAYYNAIANGGISKTLFLNQENSKTGQSIQIMSKNTAEYISTALQGVTENYGIDCKCFGKTGTAELDNERAHSWFVCSLNDELAPKYTILTFLENGGSSSFAKSLTKEYINNYILN